MALDGAGDVTTQPVEVVPPEGGGETPTVPTTETPPPSSGRDGGQPSVDDAGQARLGQLERSYRWLEQQYQGSLQQIQKLQGDLREYEYAGLDEGEAAQRQLQDRTQQLQEQEYRIQEQQYASDLYRFYAGYVPTEAIQGYTPSEWQQSVLSHMQGEAKHLQGEVTRLQGEVKALKSAARPGDNAPKVPSGGGGPASGKRSLYAMTWEEREAMRQQAELGTLRPEDYPAVPE